MIDGMGNHDIGITNNHMKVHKGLLFSTAVYKAALATNGTFDISLKPGSKSTHLEQFYVQTSSPLAAIAIIEAPTGVTGGSAVVPFNHNRYSTKTYGGVIKIEPTGTTGGTSLPVGAVLAAFAPSELTSIAEYVLKTDTQYVLRCTNAATAAANIVVRLVMYEN